MEIKRLSTILKLIANPERMAILFLLLDGDRSITELAQALDSSPTGIANHLARLRTEGIMISRATTASSNTASSPKKPPPSSIPCARSKTKPNKQIISHHNIKAV